MALDHLETDQRAKFLSARDELLLDLDGRLSADGIRHRKRARRRGSFGWSLALRAATTVRRLADIFLAIVFMIILGPIMLVALATAKLCGGGIIKQERLGRWATRFNLYRLHFPGTSKGRTTFFEKLPALLNVLKGDMSFIGPRPIAPGEEFAEKRLAWKRYDLRPGLLSLWWIRKRANIAYSSEVSLDLEYVETKSFWGDLGIAARAIPATLYGTGGSNAPPQIHFLGVRINNLTMAEASNQIVTYARGDKATQVCFVNADCVNISCADPVYRATLSDATLVLADGIGVRLAGAILDQNVRENVNGTDMLPYLCDAAGKWMTHHYPHLRLAGTRNGYFTPEEQDGVLEQIRLSGADIVLVAMGAPRQDKWIAEHKDKAGAKVLIGVGGLLDFYSGRIPRAPVWIRELGMEWLYRFYCEPRRMWRRYFVGNFDFLYRVVGERMRMRAAERAEGNAR